MKRHNPIPQAWGPSPIEFINQDSPNQNLDGEDLRDANLKGSDLSGSSFRNADLSGANLVECDLSGCDFTGANLDRANLAFATVGDAVFDRCSISSTVLFAIVELLEIGSFTPIDFGQIAGFSVWDELDDIEMPETLKDLRSSTDPEQVVQYLELILGMAGVYEFLPESPFFYAEMPYGTLLLFHGDFRHLSFEGAVIPSGTDFGKSDLRGVSFRNATISGDANMTRSQIEGADFEGVNQTEEYDYGSDVGDIIGSARVSLVKGVYPCEAPGGCPDGTVETDVSTTNFYEVILDKRGRLGKVCRECAMNCDACGEYVNYPWGKGEPVIYCPACGEEML